MVAFLLILRDFLGIMLLRFLLQPITVHNIFVLQNESMRMAMFKRRRHRRTKAEVEAEKAEKSTYINYTIIKFHYPATCHRQYYIIWSINCPMLL